MTVYELNTLIMNFDDKSKQKKLMLINFIYLFIYL